MFFVHSFKVSNFISVKCSSDWNLCYSKSALLVKQFNRQTATKSSNEDARSQPANGRARALLPLAAVAASNQRGRMRSTFRSSRLFLLLF